MNLANRSTGRAGFSVGVKAVTARTILSRLGVVTPAPDYPNQSRFWDRFSDETLNDLIASAETQYRSKMKLAHPDAGGSHAVSAELSGLMDRLRKMFARRGGVAPMHLQSDGSMSFSPVHKLMGVRNCIHCGTEFDVLQNNPDKKYCTRDCTDSALSGKRAARAIAGLAHMRSRRWPKQTEIPA